MKKWDYKHEYVEAQKLEGTGKREGLFGGGKEKMQEVYAFDEVGTRLSQLGSEGWELLQAEPHWIWGNMTYGAPLWARALDKHRRKVEAAASYPSHINGWYCTFRREQP